jgi:hypothetical protein
MIGHHDTFMNDHFFKSCNGRKIIICESKNNNNNNKFYYFAPCFKKFMEKDE